MSPYNSALDDCGCTDTYLYGKPYAGCVAIAMVQVMNYHKKPQWVNWSVATSATGFGYADVIKDAGLVIGTRYGCGGSSADTGNVPNALKSRFGYASADFRDGFSSEIVKDNIRRNMPVILAGNKKNGWSWIGGYGPGHAWVCDGYRTLENCHARALYLHMNWGWGDKVFNSSNGYYGVGEWWKSRTGGHYSENQRMVYNIKP